MGAIKDIVDLTKELESRAKDRRDMDTIHKIQTLAFSLQSQQVEIVERDLALMAENAQLKKQMGEFTEEEIRIHTAIEFRRGKRTGGRWIPFCPQCHTPASAVERDRTVYCPTKCAWHVPLVRPMEVLISELGT